MSAPCDPAHARSGRTLRALDAARRAENRRVAAGVLVAVAILVAIVLTFSGCAPSEAYRRADRLTFDAIAAEYSAYVAGDAALSSKQKERRLRTLRTWDVRSATGEAEQAPSAVESQ